VSKLTKICSSRLIRTKKFRDSFNIVGDFFKGRVVLLEQGIVNAVYRLDETECTIKINNNLHLRLLQNQFSHPLTEVPFEIIAPLEAVKVLTYNIPIDLITSMSAGDYLNLKATFYS